MTRMGRYLDDKIALKYGAGSRAMRTLIEELLADGFPAGRDGDVGLGAMDDGAALRIGDKWLILTTDSHVVKPIAFPGGDIGRLAISGTVNDLAVMGATEPLGLTCAAIFEEGLPRRIVERVWTSMRETCAEAGVTVVTGDTKVMGHGEVDGVVINTTGVAVVDRVLRDSGLQPGDKIIVTGTVGDHGLAVMATRNALALETDLRSDVAPINGLIRQAMSAAEGGITAIKDPTRGGLASALHDMAEKSKVGITLDEQAVPVRDQVRAVGELLGIDPLHVANEGKAVLGVSPGRVDEVLSALRAHALGRDAAVIGTCVRDKRHRVVLDTGFGRRLLAEPEGEPTPRIC